LQEIVSFASFPEDVLYLDIEQGKSSLKNQIGSAPKSLPITRKGQGCLLLLIPEGLRPLLHDSLENERLTADVYRYFVAEAIEELSWNGAKVNSFSSHENRNFKDFLQSPFEFDENTLNPNRQIAGFRQSKHSIENFCPRMKFTPFPLVVI
jgi:hypothetical protein